jgi:hypothetical protein
MKTEQGFIKFKEKIIPILENFSGKLTEEQKRNIYYSDKFDEL